jgi:hypothetical protein
MTRSILPHRIPLESDPDRLLTVRNLGPHGFNLAAEPTIYNHLSAGTWPIAHVKLPGGGVRFRLGDVRAFIAAHRVATVHQPIAA